MRVPQLLIVACPECHENLDIECNEYKDELLDDQYLDAKYENLIQKFGAEVQTMLEKLKWDAKDVQETKSIIFQRVIYSGSLKCNKCQKSYPIKNRLAHFVTQSQGESAV